MPSEHRQMDCKVLLNPMKDYILKNIIQDFS